MLPMMYFPLVCASNIHFPFQLNKVHYGLYIYRNETSVDYTILLFTSSSANGDSRNNVCILDELVECAFSILLSKH